MKSSPTLIKALCLWPLLLALPVLPLHSQDVSGDGMALLTYLEPYRSIEMSPAEGGVISEILVKEGDRVLKDQILLKLDSEAIAARLSVAKAQADNMGTILAAESEYKLQKERYEKLASLEKRDVSSQYEVQRQFASMKTAEGRLTEALEMKRVYQLQVDQARAELERRFLKSPIDGIVVEIEKDVSEPVNPIEASRDEYLIRVVNISQLLAKAHLPGNLIGRVVEGSEMQIKVEGSNGDRPQVVTGRVEYVSPVIDSASNTITVKVVVDNSAGTIRAGSPAQLLVPGTTVAGESAKETAKVP
ncbi:MAG: efflux RND transporter periplasmic adaptor subunit [Verrucomicrobiae bacterium]|nr:efflux RND transporter periplasmic adaptor subunit [Verrucomicrobiae bacterium]